jgi:hypothetical protein
MPSYADVFFLAGENIPLVPLCSGQHCQPAPDSGRRYKPGVIGFSSERFTVNENGGNAVITLTRPRQC